MTTAAEQAVAIAVATVKLRKQREQQGSQHIDDPVGFIRDCLGEHPWSKQRDVAESVRDHRHTAVRSSHDTGKSFIASRLAAWWIAAHAPGEAFVVTTAPSWPQVRAILWREINRAHSKGKLPGEMNQTEWNLNGELVAYGRKPADYDEHGFQGIHARYVLVIIDEACGVPRSLWTAVETLVTNEGSRVLAIGNPDTPLSHFKEVCEPDSAWNVIHIDGLQTPNFTDEFEREGVPQVTRDELKELLLSQVWVEERREEWTEDSPLWLSKVRGEFPLVPQGQVFKELSPSQQWFGPLPAFQRLVGGLDFGGADDQAHRTAGVMSGLANDDSIDLPRISPFGSKGVLVRLASFEHAGPYVHDQLLAWMRDVERIHGRRVEWRADKSQSGWISMAINQGFHVTPSDGSSGSVDAGIGLQRRRMAAGASFFVEELTHVPQFLADDPHPIDGGPRWFGGQHMETKPWYERMTNYRWKAQPDEDKQVPGVPIKRDDDVVDADRYMHEAVDVLPSYRGPAVAKQTVSGKPLAKKAV